MFNVRQIVRNNDATFYDFNTRQKRSQLPRYIAVCLASLIAAIVCSKVSSNLLAGVLTVQSILLGFNVNVMFFLLGNREQETPEAISIETRLRSKRLRNLYRELFYNVSYFNLVAVASIIVTTGLLLPTPEVPGLLRGLQPVEAYVHWLSTSKIPTLASTISRGCAMFVFYAISMEVVFSIVRIIGRTSFYFEQNMKKVRHLDDQEEG